MRKPVREALERTRAKIVAGWTQGGYAKNSLGKAVETRSKEAVSWCLWGALEASTARRSRVQIEALQLINSEVHRSSRHHFSNITTWNDYKGRTQAQVVAVLDRLLDD